MMDDQLAEWTVSSNDAIQISLVVPSADGPKSIHSFKPAMTSALFGEDEKIKGYHNLKINLRYNASDMRPGLQITFTKKMKSTDEDDPTDLKEIFEDNLPRSSFEKSSIFDAAVQDSCSLEWKPPGELWKTIQSGDQTYEVWKGNLTDLAVQQMIKRIQIFVSFFVEGGTPIDLKEPEWSLQRWKIFFLYQKQKTQPGISPYIFMGYSTVYQFFFVETHRIDPANKSGNFTLPLPELQFLSLPCRSRISQFIILPPFQGSGNGSRFYNAIFDYYLQENRTVEVTVEDPNEAFDDLRDLNDLARLRKITEFTKLKINTATTISKKVRVPGHILNSSELEKIRKTVKIAPRQFSRLVEMQLMSSLPSKFRSDLRIGNLSKNEEMKYKDIKYEYRLWKLLVKSRLFHHNRDALIQLDFLDRIEKLDQTLWNVESDYERLLKAFGPRLNQKVLDSSLDIQRVKRAGSSELDDGEHSLKKVKL